MLGPTTWTTNKVPAILVDWAKTATILPRSSWLHVDGALTTAGPSLLRLSGPETKGFISSRCSTKKKLTTKLYLLRADTDREKLLKFGKKKSLLACPFLAQWNGIENFQSGNQHFLTYWNGLAFMKPRNVNAIKYERIAVIPAGNRCVFIQIKL